MPTCPMCDSHDLTTQANRYGVKFCTCRGCGATMSTEAATPGSVAHEFIRADVYGTTVNVNEH